MALNLGLGLALTRNKGVGVAVLRSRADGQPLVSRNGGYLVSRSA